MADIIIRSPLVNGDVSNLKMNTYTSYVHVKFRAVCTAPNAVLNKVLVIIPTVHHIVAEKAR
jgi:hypothetical protein